MHSKTARDYKYSPSVDKYLGLLDTDGFLSNVPNKHRFVSNSDDDDDVDII